MTRQSIAFDTTDFQSCGVIPFNTGSDAGAGIVAGDTITQATSGATARVHRVDLTSGSWAGGDAAGNLIITKTDTINFNATDQISNDGGTATCSPNGAPTNEGNFDGRFPRSIYVAQIEYDNSTSGTKTTLLDATLVAILTAADYGFIFAANDELQIPININQGRRVDQSEGQFGVFGFWDDDAGTGTLGRLEIFVVFMGLRGTADGSNTIIPEAVLSLDVVNQEAGDFQPLDLSAVSFVLSFDTDDSGNGTSINRDPGSGQNGGQIGVK